MDCGRDPWLTGVMADTRDLILNLVTRAGMIAEDIAAIAISSPGDEGPDLAVLIEQVQRQLGQASTLIEAALALFDRELAG